MEGFWLVLKPWPPSFLTLTLVVAPGAADAGRTAATTAVRATSDIDAARAPGRDFLVVICLTSLPLIG
jgi:hypothetical protein